MQQHIIYPPKIVYNQKSFIKQKMLLCILSRKIWFIKFSRRNEKYIYKKKLAIIRSKQKQTILLKCGCLSLKIVFGWFFFFTNFEILIVHRMVMMKGRYLPKLFYKSKNKSGFYNWHKNYRKMFTLKLVINWHVF